MCIRVYEVRQGLLGDEDDAERCGRRARHSRPVPMAEIDRAGQRRMVPVHPNVRGLVLDQAWNEILIVAEEHGAGERKFGFVTPTHEHPDYKS